MPQLDRSAIIDARLAATGLDRRRSWSSGLSIATAVGLQDSMPRAALLSLHARVDDVGPDALDDPELVQVWGPRFSVFVVRADDTAPFTLGRLPATPAKRDAAVAIADRLAEFLDGGAATANEARRALGVHPNQFRYAAPTGRLLVEWDGARRPLLRMVDPPDVTPEAARAELVRRFLSFYRPRPTNSEPGPDFVPPVPVPPSTRCRPRQPS